MSPHDCVGTNLNGHVLRGRLMRVVPRANDEINETWIADRDRFSYEGFYAADRAQKPMVKHGGDWREVDWETALESAAKGLQSVVRRVGRRPGRRFWPRRSARSKNSRSPRSSRADSARTTSITVCVAIDFRDQANDPVAPMLGCSLVELEQAAAVLVVGSNLRKEVPLIAHRIRQGAVRRSAKVAFINPAVSR